MGVYSLTAGIAIPVLPFPVISWLCDTEQVASPFWASVTLCIKWVISSYHMHEVVVTFKHEQGLPA